jgi:hypothetical protein|tara:strand:- start:4170 stop:4355 length:186 start_codon:yes stop_codon:yes gene_type:complete
MDKMQVLINEFYQSEKKKIRSEGTFGFEAVGGFLFYFLPPKSEEAETFRSSRERKNYFENK